MATLTKRQTQPLALQSLTEPLAPAIAPGPLVLQRGGVSERSAKHGLLQNWRQISAQTRITQSGYDPNTLYDIGKTKTLNCSRTPLYQ